MVLACGVVRDSDCAGRVGVELGSPEVVEVVDVVVDVVREAVRGVVFDVELDAGAVVDELVVCARGTVRAPTNGAD